MITNPRILQSWVFGDILAHQVEHNIGHPKYSTYNDNERHLCRNELLVDILTILDCVDSAVEVSDAS